MMDGQMIIIARKGERVHVSYINIKKDEIQELLSDTLFNHMTGGDDNEN